jgi:5-methylcytosine-specific restriction enzyme subunit McrC
MKKFVIPEYGRIDRNKMGLNLINRLQSFDEKHTRAGQSPIFDWGHRNYIRALNNVGVVQVPGIQVEILPKIDHSFEENIENKTLENAQSNLLYMLSLTKRLPLVDRDLSSLNFQKFSFLEILFKIFVERLIKELRKGLDHSYINKEENVYFVKGKILINQNIKYNFANKERTFVNYDEFVSDTWLNRILKFCCKEILFLSHQSKTQMKIREALLIFSEVKDFPVREHHFAKVHLTRNTERFSELLDFCLLIIKRTAPTPSSGAAKTFSLLFPMNILFEEFIARFIKKNSDFFGIKRSSVHIQAEGKRKWLLRKPNGPGKFRLKPDLIIENRPGEISTVLDTKWKRLRKDIEDSKNGVSQADMYQIFAYAKQYNSSKNIMLFPKVQGVTAKDFYVDGEEEKQISISFVNLNRNLFKEKNEFKEELKEIIFN